MSSIPKTLCTKLNIEHLFGFVWEALQMTNVWTVTDLRIGQIGHGLGPRAFRGPAQLFPMTTQYSLIICEIAQRHNFTIYLEMSGNANVYSRLLSVQ